MSGEDKTMDTFEAAVFLGINAHTLGDWCRRGVGPKCTLRAPIGRGGRSGYRFLAADLIQFMQARESDKRKRMLDKEHARLIRRVEINKKYYKLHKEKWDELNARRRKGADILPGDRAQ